jgi:two-component system response regulator RegX3
MPPFTSPLPEVLPNAGVHAATEVRTRLLVVEDEQAIAVPLAEGLEREGFEVVLATTGREAIAKAPTVDFVLLDLGLPDIDGADVCRAVRSVSQQPIIVVTARGEELDRVLLLELGADDYVVKPFGFRELVARIRAVRRRTETVADAPGIHTPIELGPVRLDRDARRVFVHDSEISLAPKEFDLLAKLAEHPGTVLRREQLIEEVWDEHWWGSTKTLDVHVASLRKKLGAPGLIATVRGVGYRLDVDA